MTVSELAVEAILSWVVLEIRDGEVTCMKGKSLPEAESPAHLTFKEYKDSENPAHERIM